LKIALIVLGIFVLVGIAAWAASSKQPTLAVGDAAPPFSLPGSDGKTHSLADQIGHRAVVLAWFPKAFTSG